MEQIKKLYNLCFSNTSNETNNQRDTKKILQLLTNIIKKSSDIQLENYDPQEILACSVKILFLCDDEFFQARKFTDKRPKNYNTAKTCYCELLELFIPTRRHQVINFVIEFIHNENYWQWYDLCHDLIFHLLTHTEHDVVHCLLDKAMSVDTIPNDGILIIRNLSVVLENYSWPMTQETVEIIEKFLELYHCGIDNTENISENISERCEFLLKGLEVCIRNIMNNLSNNYLLHVIKRMCCWAVGENTEIPPKTLNYGSILEYACSKHQTDSLEDTLTDEIFPMIMQMIASTNNLISLLGNRALQHLIDRNKNREQFLSPQIFYQDTKYNLQMKLCNKRDEEFLKQRREILHDTFVNCVMQHGSSRLNLESTYCTLCLLATEVPCGFTAAALVCLIMNIQNLTLTKPERNEEIDERVHATVLAVFTLICYIHQAEILYNYINKVMMERAQWAPHLNPPLKTHTAPIYPALCDKPGLYFVDWEVRFGLWKCFRLRANKIDDEIV